MKDWSTWTDHDGTVRRAPTILHRLKFCIPLHAALRAFVLRRDGFRCVTCGIPAVDVPENYTGRDAVMAEGNDGCLVADHIVSRKNGGAHHPDNLQTLCGSCNSRKAAMIDAKGHAHSFNNGAV